MSYTNTPLVSVIIAFLNEKRFLDEAIKSVLQQDYTNWELIIVDDGSTDGSTDIALEYTKNYDGSIIYLQHEGHINKGLSASRNLGIKNADGHLIAFLDADDVWLPDKLTRQVAIFEQNEGIAMVAEASNYWYNWNDSNHENVLIPVGTKQDEVYNPPSLMFRLYPLGSGAAPCPSSLMLTKEAILKAGNFEESFKHEFSLYEDQAFLSKIYLNEKVYISSQCNNLYRQRPESIVSTVHSSGLYRKVRYYFLEWLEGYLKRHNTSNKQLNQLLKKAMFPYRFPAANYIINIMPKTVWTGYKKVVHKATLFARQIIAKK